MIRELIRATTTWHSRMRRVYVRKNRVRYGIYIYAGTVGTRGARTYARARALTLTLLAVGHWIGVTCGAAVVAIPLVKP